MIANRGADARATEGGHQADKRGGERDEEKAKVDQEYLGSATTGFATSDRLLHSSLIARYVLGICFAVYATRTFKSATISVTIILNTPRSSQTVIQLRTRRKHGITFKESRT